MRRVTGRNLTLLLKGGDGENASPAERVSTFGVTLLSGSLGSVASLPSPLDSLARGPTDTSRRSRFRGSSAKAGHPSGSFLQINASPPEENRLETLELMLAELESRRLVVCLAPAPERRHEGHCVRVAIESNAPWYRRFCANYQGANGTFNKRANTIKALKRFIASQTVGRVYGLRLLAAAREYKRKNLIVT
jgi:hypothetical protein